jgi:hypothetical protein
MNTGHLSQSFTDVTSGNGSRLLNTFTDFDCTGEYVRFRLAPREMHPNRYVGKTLCLTSGSEWLNKL